MLTRCVLEQQLPTPPRGDPLPAGPDVKHKFVAVGINVQERRGSQLCTLNMWRMLFSFFRSFVQISAMMQSEGATVEGREEMIPSYDANNRWFRKVHKHCVFFTIKSATSLRSGDEENKAQINSQDWFSAHIKCQWCTWKLYFWCSCSISTLILIKWILQGKLELD